MASTDAQVSLSGRSAGGAGTTIDFTSAKARVGAILSVSGTASSGIISIEASHDNITWVALHVFDALTGSNRFWASPGGAFRYWRGNVLRAIAGGGTITLTFMEAD